MMKKTLVSQLFIVCFACLFMACDDNDDNSKKGYVSSLNGMYSNKSAALGKNDLSLVYSGNEIYGKEIYFKQTEENRGDFTLFGVIPGEKEFVLSDIALRKNDEGYGFFETIVAESGSFIFTGGIQTGKLDLTLGDVNLNNSTLSAYNSWNVFVGGKQVRVTDEEGTYTHYYHTTHLKWTPFPEGPIISLFPDIFRALFEKIIFSTLKDISFKPDGNMTLNYATFPDDMNFVSNILLGSGYPDRPDEDWNELPESLFNYYLKDSDLYIVPNSEMIIRWLQASTRAEGENGDDLNFDLIKEVYGQITEWFTTGIKLTIRDNPQQPYTNEQGNRVKYEGDILLVLDKSQLEAFLPLLPYIKGMLSESVLETSAVIGGLKVGELLDLVVTALTDAEVFEIGIYLSKMN